MRLAPWSAAVLLLFAACGRPAPAPPSSPAPRVQTDSSPSDVSPPSPTPTLHSGEDRRPPPSTPPSCPEREGGDNTYVVLKDVRVGTHPGYDRITFEFAAPSQPPSPPAPPGVLPRYELKRVNALTEDGSGRTVPVAGAVLFQVVFHGATGAQVSGERVERTFPGPTEVKPDFEQLAELEQTGDFEAVLSWGFGVKHPVCPTVTELGDPLRLAIDIPH